jgi:hypothetical protein
MFAAKRRIVLVSGLFVLRVPEVDLVKNLNSL